MDRHNLFNEALIEWNEAYKRPSLWDKRTGIDYFEWLYENDDQYRKQADESSRKMKEAFNKYMEELYGKEEDKKAEEG